MFRHSRLTSKAVSIPSEEWGPLLLNLSDTWNENNVTPTMDLRRKWETELFVYLLGLRRTGESNSWVSAEADGGTWLHLLKKRNTWQVSEISSKFGRGGIQISPLKSRKLCLLQLGLAVSCSSRHRLAQWLGRGESWHKLGLTRKWFSLPLRTEGEAASLPFEGAPGEGGIKNCSAWASS